MDIFFPPKEMTFADHQKKIWAIINKTDITAQAKGEELATSAKLYSSNTPLFNLYNSWANGQFVYHYLHAPLLTDEQRIEGMKKYPAVDVANTIRDDIAIGYRDKINWLWRMQKVGVVKAQDMPNYVATIAVSDIRHEMSVADKVVVLNSWLLKFDKNPKYTNASLVTLKSALGGQREALKGKPSAKSAWHEPIKKVDVLINKAEQTVSGVQSQYTQIGQLTVSSILKHPYLNSFLKNHPDIQSKAESALKLYWADIKQDCDIIWAHKGGNFQYAGLSLWGPDNNVTPEMLAAQVSLHYLKVHFDFNPNGAPNTSLLQFVHFMHAIVSQETTWYPSKIGYSNGVRNGIGPYQLTPSVFWDLGFSKSHRQNLHKVLSKFGESLDSNFGTFVNPKTGRREPLIWIRDNKNNLTPVDWIAKYDPKERGKAPRLRNIMWNPAAEPLLQNPGFAVDLALPVMIYKGARPDMGTATARNTAENYNGNIKPAYYVSMRKRNRHGRMIKVSVPGPSVKDEYEKKVVGGYKTKYDNENKKIDTP